MQKRKWWLVAGITVALVLLCAYLARPFPPAPPGPGITWDNADRIQPGMSSEDAERVVGYPPQMETPGIIWDDPPLGSRTILMWSGTKCDILVYLDGNRSVIGSEAVPPRRTPSWHVRLRKRLGLGS